jgi:hypothetical protein
MMWLKMGTAILSVWPSIPGDRIRVRERRGAHLSDPLALFTIVISGRCPIHIVANRSLVSIWHAQTFNFLERKQPDGLVLVAD